MKSCKKAGHLVAVTLLVEGGQGADDGEEHRAQTSQQEVKGARRGAEGPEDDEDKDLEENGICSNYENEDDLNKTMTTLPPKDRG